MLSTPVNIPEFECPHPTMFSKYARKLRNSAQATMPSYLYHRPHPITALPVQLSTRKLNNSILSIATNEAVAQFLLAFVQRFLSLHGHKQHCHHVYTSPSTCSSHLLPRKTARIPRFRVCAAARCQHPDPCVNTLNYPRPVPVNVLPHQPRPA